MTEFVVHEDFSWLYKLGLMEVGWADCIIHLYQSEPFWQRYCEVRRFPRLLSWKHSAICSHRKQYVTKTFALTKWKLKQAELDTLPVLVRQNPYSRFMSMSLYDQIHVIQAFGSVIEARLQKLEQQKLKRLQKEQKRREQVQSTFSMKQQEHCKKYYFLDVFDLSRSWKWVLQQKQLRRQRFKMWYAEICWHQWQYYLDVVLVYAEDFIVRGEGHVLDSIRACEKQVHHCEMKRRKMLKQLKALGLQEYRKMPIFKRYVLDLVYDKWVLNYAVALHWWKQLDPELGLPTQDVELPWRLGKAEDATHQKRIAVMKQWLKGSSKTKLRQICESLPAYVIDYARLVMGHSPLCDCGGLAAKDCIQQRCYFCCDCDSCARHNGRIFKYQY